MVCKFKCQPATTGGGMDHVHEQFKTAWVTIRKRKRGSSFKVKQIEKETGGISGDRSSLTNLDSKLKAMVRSILSHSPSRSTTSTRRARTVICETEPTPETEIPLALVETEKEIGIVIEKPRKPGEETSVKIVKETLDKTCGTEATENITEKNMDGEETAETGTETASEGEKKLETNKKVTENIDVDARQNQQTDLMKILKQVHLVKPKPAARPKT